MGAEQKINPPYKFQADWFSHNIPVWERVLEEFKDQPNLHFLEVGSFEGCSTVWTLNNILSHDTSSIVCIDTFEGSQEYQGLGIASTQMEQTFRYNIALTGAGNKVDARKGLSFDVLRTLPENNFDFAYIDASHTASDVITDAVLAFPLIKNGGIMCFDDYEWDLDPDPLNRPKIAIKAFLEIFQRQYELLHKQEQVFIRKISNK